MKKSMSGAAAVKHMAIDENSKPPKNMTSGMRKTKGEVTRGTAVNRLAKPITASTIEALIVARVAPQSSSPATTSSTLTGVAMMASKVFWKYMRTNEANVHSKNEPFIIEMATNAGAMKLTYGPKPTMLGMNPPSPNPKAKRYRIGSISEGKKLTFMVFMNTSKLRCQTFQTL